jgi:hypothetical protein
MAESAVDRAREAMNKALSGGKWPVVALKVEALREGLAKSGWREQGPESRLEGTTPGGIHVVTTWWNRGRDPALMLTVMQYPGDSEPSAHLWRAAATTSDARRWMRRKVKAKE